VIGSGHSPEHACLVDEAGKVMIAGDQVLPRITSNVSLSLSEPEADPLGEWLASIARLKHLPDDLLVLPSHGEPFTGLHARLDALAEGHRGRLDALHEFLSEPRRAVDCFGILFGRKIEDSSMGLATGEAMAHLRHLEVEGRARRENCEGVHWYSRSPSA
jgi:glyoxylase-like metal-dependent hydrolase (beta-lactamase superfamily II)